jgi:hypothetical protein
MPSVDATLRHAGRLVVATACLLLLAVPRHADAQEAPLLLVERKDLENCLQHGHAAGAFLVLPPLAAVRW